MASSSSSFLVLLVVVVLASARQTTNSQTPPPPSENKIYGGQVTDISLVPWQVALQGYGQQFCGGTIIGPRWVLTAAHCTPDEDASNLGVRVGSNRRDSDGRYYEVEEVLVHEDYVRYWRDDISLLRTKEPMVLGDKTAAASLPDQDEAPPAVGEELTASGWGNTDNAYMNGSDVLHAVDVRVVAFSECARRYARYGPDERLQLCAFSPGQDTCKGDSGGPLVYGTLLVGVVSYGDLPCGEHPGVYTKVSAYRSWIREKTGL